MLLRQLQPQEHRQQQPQQRKCKSEKNLFKNSGGRRLHTNNAGTTTTTSDPPDPHNGQDHTRAASIHENQTGAPHDLLTLPNPIGTTANLNHNPMDTDDKSLEGGINDDDLSEQMIQDWEESTTQASAMSDSPEANRKKND